MLVVPDWWVWDFWVADDGEQFHAYFLQAPARVPADDRHWNVCVGHAVSPDLREWEVLGTALAPSREPAFDDFATWTGSVVRADDGVWQMFYTGLTRADRGMVQRVGLATSADLHHWSKESSDALVVADPRWYSTFDRTGRAEAWRDPWVMRDPGGDGWHMFVTASARDVPEDQAGVIAHARSADLRTWEVGPPVTAPGSGFAQLEVVQVELVDGEPVVLFSCLGPELSLDRRARGESGGVWAMTTDSLTGPFDPTRARLVTDQSLYVGRVVRDRSGQWVMLAFHNEGADGRFVGWISDPIPWQSVWRGAPASASVVRADRVGGPGR